MKDLDTFVARLCTKASVLWGGVTEVSFTLGYHPELIREAPAHICKVYLFADVDGGHFRLEANGPTLDHALKNADSQLNAKIRKRQAELEGVDITEQDP